jgi:hypothetical protein
MRYIFIILVALCPQATLAYDWSIGLNAGQYTDMQSRTLNTSSLIPEGSGQVFSFRFTQSRLHWQLGAKVDYLARHSSSRYTSTPVNYYTYTYDAAKAVTLPIQAFLNRKLLRGPLVPYVGVSAGVVVYMQHEPSPGVCAQVQAGVSYTIQKKLVLNAEAAAGAMRIKGSAFSTVNRATTMATLGIGYML